MKALTQQQIKQHEVNYQVMKDVKAALSSYDVKISKKGSWLKVVGLIAAKREVECDIVRIIERIWGYSNYRFEPFRYTQAKAS